MGLTRALLRFAAARPHVLVAEVPGGTGVRLAVEAQLRRRGWPAATHPADTDVLVVAGPAGARWSSYVDRVWTQVPAPRVRLATTDATRVAAALDEATARLADGGEPPAPGTAADAEELAMPDRGEDRDGLMLDQLHVPLGPLLTDWPAGLVVHTTLQGDVIQHARSEIIPADGPAEPFWAMAPRRQVAAQLDSLSRLLAVAGWHDAVLRTRRLRDEVLAGASVEHAAPRLQRLARRLHGSRAFHRLAGGDVTERWREWLATAERMLPQIDEPGRAQRVDPPDPAALERLPGLLEGAELGTARLIVAGLDPDLAELAARQDLEVAGG